MQIKYVYIIIPFFLACSNKKLTNGLYLNTAENVIYFNDDSMHIFNPVHEVIHFDKEKYKYKFSSFYFGCLHQTADYSVDVMINIKQDHCFKLETTDSCIKSKLKFIETYCLFDKNDIKWDSITNNYNPQYNVNVVLKNSELVNYSNLNSFISLESEIQLILSNKINKTLNSKSSSPKSIWDVYYKGNKFKQMEIQYIPFYLSGIQSIVYKNFKFPIE